MFEVRGVPLDIAAGPVAHAILKVRNDEGCELLAIWPDGSVTGAIEDSGEAARIFMKFLEESLQGHTQAYARELARHLESLDSGHTLSSGFNAGFRAAIEELKLIGGYGP